MSSFPHKQQMRKWFHTIRRTKPIRTSSPKATRLQVEPLEDRLVLSLTAFASFQYFPNGSTPDCGLVEDSSGNLFGTTSSGGTSNDGTVFEVKAGSGAITILASFNGANGSNPQGNLVEDSSGNLFGFTTSGGTSADGTVFEVKAGSDVITPVVSFNGSNGANPQGNLIEDGNGNLFGTTGLGGPSGDGTVFEILAGSSAVTTLASFDALNLANPQSLVEDPSGDLFGTTTDANNSANMGAVFEVKAGSAAVTTVATFEGGDGPVPSSRLVEDSAGNLFGTASGGFALNAGMVFEVAAGSGAITDLASFDGANGANPQGLVEDSSGNLFGTALVGSPGDFEVFEVAAGSSTITSVASFSGHDQPGPEADLIVDSKGNLFGTTPGEFRSGLGGGQAYSGIGTVFKVAAGSGAITTVAAFAGFVGSPNHGLLEDAKGNFFGTAEDGGTADEGAIWELAAGSNTITLLASFTGVNGNTPSSNLVEDSNGNLFGTTTLGGASNLGTIFEVVADSDTIITLASFDGANGSNPGTIISDSSGDLFGMTGAGGASKVGVVFELAVGSKTITALASFSTPSGGNAASPLLDRGGNLFGTAYGGPGMVFEVAAGSNTITPLASFGDPTGASSLSGLIADSSGNLFGTTYAGGSMDEGTIFELAVGSSNVTTLASFNGINGLSPNSALVEDSRGNLFGTTFSDFTTGQGTAFELPAGSSIILTVATFNDTSGESPAGLLDDIGGNFFGVATYGGADQAGTIFVLSISAPSSTVLPLAPLSTASFNVSWYGTDKPGGAGIASYSIYVSDNGGPFTPFLTDTTQTSATFTGAIGHTYGFYSIATDQGGNVQDTPTAAEATTTTTPTYAIGGTVFRDYNQDQRQESGEPGLPGQTVFLDLNATGVLQAGDPTSTTAADGSYSFTGLAGGMYYIHEAPVSGVLQTSQRGGGYAVAAEPGANLSNYDFGDVITSIAVPLTLPPNFDFPAQGSANADYVEALYLSVLGRGGDQSGVTYWSGVLTSGSLSRLQVVQGIRNSPEHLAQEVNAFYATLLGRAADSAGVSYWVAQLQNGVREEQIAFDFLDSSEYLSKGDKYFVDSMYQSLLGRSPEASGEAYWLQQLGDNAAGNPTQTPLVTHAQVINDFLFSEESLERLVEGYYEVFLERPADPGGMNSWVAELQQGLPFLTIGEEFLSSDEFYNRAAANK